MSRFEERLNELVSQLERNAAALKTCKPDDKWNHERRIREALEAIQEIYRNKYAK
jgi:flagellar biosynthesis regulator FlbT